MSLSRWWPSLMFLMATTTVAQRAPVVAVHRDSAAVLLGRLSDSSGAAISGAHVTLMQGDSATTVTSDSGMFRFAALAPGPNLFSVRRFGFEPLTVTVMLKPATTHNIKVVMEPSSQALPAVAVSDTGPTTHWLDAFDERRAHHPGTFLTRKDFAKRDPKNGSDILRMVPGVAVGTGPGGNRVVFTRTTTRRCMATMYIHGSPFGGQIDDIPVDDIEAIEVYVGVSEIPPELDRGGRNLCAVINVWTRDPRRPPEEQPSDRRQHGER
jgi:hypothetical protein